MILLIKEAGGVVMNYEGNEYQLGNDSIIACTPSIYQELSERMNWKLSIIQYNTKTVFVNWFIFKSLHITVWV